MNNQEQLPPKPNQEREPEDIIRENLAEANAEKDRLDSARRLIRQHDKALSKFLPRFLFDRQLRTMTGEHQETMRARQSDIETLKKDIEAEKKSLEELRREWRKKPEELARLEKEQTAVYAHMAANPEEEARATETIEHLQTKIDKIYELEETIRASEISIAGMEAEKNSLQTEHNQAKAKLYLERTPQHKWRMRYHSDSLAKEVADILHRGLPKPVTPEKINHSETASQEELLAYEYSNLAKLKNQINHEADSDKRIAMEAELEDRLRALTDTIAALPESKKYKTIMKTLAHSELSSTFGFPELRNRLLPLLNNENRQLAEANLEIGRDVKATLKMIVDDLVDGDPLHAKESLAPLAELAAQMGLADLLRQYVSTPFLYIVDSAQSRIEAQNRAYSLADSLADKDRQVDESILLARLYMAQAQIKIKDAAVPGNPKNTRDIAHNTVGSLNQMENANDMSEDKTLDQKQETKLFYIKQIVSEIPTNLLIEMTNPEHQSSAIIKASLFKEILIRAAQSDARIDIEAQLSRFTADPNMPEETKGFYLQSWHKQGIIDETQILSPLTSVLETLAAHNQVVQIRELIRQSESEQLKHVLEEIYVQKVLAGTRIKDLERSGDKEKRLKDEKVEEAKRGLKNKSTRERSAQGINPKEMESIQKQNRDETGQILKDTVRQLLVAGLVKRAARLIAQQEHNYGWSLEDFTTIAREVRQEKTQAKDNETAQQITTVFNLSRV